MFDQIVIKEDDDTRGRERGNAAELIRQGVEQVLSRVPDPRVTHETILNETQAIETTLNRAPNGGLVVILPESVSRAISLIEARNPIKDSLTGQNGTASAPITSQV
jgi:cyanophycin synthetase